MNWPGLGERPEHHAASCYSCIEEMGVMWRVSNPAATAGPRGCPGLEHCAVCSVHSGKLREAVDRSRRAPS